MKGLIRGSKRNIPPSEVLSKLGFSTTSPALPKMKKEWNRAEYLMQEK